MQFPSFMSQYEAVIVPSYLVPSIKSIIQQYSHQPQGYIPNFESSTSNTSTVCDLLTSAVSLGNPIVSMPMQQPVQLVQQPVKQSVQPVKQPVQLIQEPLLKKIDVKKNSSRYSDHSVCIDWMTNKCYDLKCGYDHYYPTIFKTQICKYWESGNCKFKMEECRYAHGKYDPYNIKTYSTNYYIDSNNGYPKRSRSRSRSRERYFPTRPQYFIDNGSNNELRELPDKNINYYKK
jgi:hypothetical protein